MSNDDRASAPINLSGDELPECAGVYLMMHRVTGDTYVGSSKNIRVRVLSHVSSLRPGGASCHRKLVELVIARGLKFDVGILERCAPDIRLAAERKWIGRLRPTLNSQSIISVVPRQMGPKPQPQLPRFWVTSTNGVHKELRHLAIDLDTSAEKLAGIIVTEAVARAKGDPEQLRKLLPRK